MRPQQTLLHAYEPPRWRNRRMRDLRDLAAAYATAIVVALTLVAAMATAPVWFFADPAWVTRIARIGLAVAVYIASGALLIAFAAHRMSGWEGVRLVPMRQIGWLTFLAWPLLIGALLIRLANPTT